MRTLCLVLLLCATQAFAQSGKVLKIEGFTFPASLPGMKWLSVTNYAAEVEAHGVGVSYRGPRVKADVYIYDALNPEWEGLSVFDRIQKERESIRDVFDTMVADGRYSDVEIKKSEKLEIGKRPIDHVEIDFTQLGEGRAQPLRSHYYLTELFGKVLKIRISMVPDADPEMARQILEEVIRTVDKGPEKP